MNRELSRLLGEAGQGIGAPLPDPLPWDRVLMVHNFGAVVVDAGRFSAQVWERGFHLVLLSSMGDPTHYCKCRPRHPSGLPHPESAALEFFCAHPRMRASVPETRTATDARMEVQVSRFVMGDRLDGVYPDLSRREAERLTRRVLRVAREMAEAILEAAPATPDEGPSVSPVQAAADALLTLPEIGLPPEDVDSLRTGMQEAARVPPIPQHGDLWPANVILDGSGNLCLIDFENHGGVLVPLYDVFHFLHTAGELAAPSDRRPWIERLQADEASGAFMRSVVREEMAHWGMSVEEAAGCLLFYLVDIPTTIRARGTPESFWGPYRDELPFAARLLRESGSLRALGHRIFSGG